MKHRVPTPRRRDDRLDRKDVHGLGVHRLEPAAEPGDEGVEALVRRARDGEEAEAAALGGRLQGGDLLVGSDLDLVGAEDALARGQLGGEGLELALDDGDGLLGGVGVLGVEGGGVDEVADEARALDVPEEADAEAVAFAGPFDEAGDVGRDEGLEALPGDDAEVGDERREGVVGDLRARGGDGGDERRLAGVREADERDVGEELQLEGEGPPLAFAARVGATGRAVRRGGEVLVAAPALSALDDDEDLPVLGEVGEDLAGVGVLDDGADGNGDVDVGALLPLAVRAHAVLATAGDEPLLEAEGVEGVEVLVGVEADAAAVSPVAAVRAAVRLALLAAERDTAVAAIAGHDLDRRLVEKHPSETRAGGFGSGRLEGAPAGISWQQEPRCRGARQA